MSFGRFGAFRLVPPPLVSVARQALAAQGADPAVLQDDGTLDSMGLLTMVFDTVSVKTAAGMDFSIDLKAPPDPATHQFLADLQPAIIFTGKGGTAKIAPYGEPSGISKVFGSGAASIGVGAIGVGIGLFALYKFLKD